MNLLIKYYVQTQHNVVFWHYEFLLPSLLFCLFSFFCLTAIESRSPRKSSSAYLNDAQIHKMFSIGKLNILLFHRLLCIIQISIHKCYAKKY